MDHGLVAAMRLMSKFFFLFSILMNDIFEFVY
jgi:hypothetical protein